MTSIPLRVQPFHHGLEFADIAGRRIRRVRREVTDAVVAPVIAQPVLDQVPVADKGVYRHQLDRSYTQALEVFDNRFGGQAGIGTAVRLGYLGVLDGKSLDVQFVDDGIVPGGAQGRVIAPGEGGVDHPALGTPWALLRGSANRSSGLVADGVTEQGVVPAHATGDILGIRIQQQFVGIEAMAVVGS